MQVVDCLLKVNIINTGEPVLVEWNYTGSTVKTVVDLETLVDLCGQDLKTFSPHHRPTRSLTGNRQQELWVSYI